VLLLLLLLLVVLQGVPLFGLLCIVVCGVGAWGRVEVDLCMLVCMLLCVLVCMLL
jgi:hypothetical protein